MLEADLGGAAGLVLGLNITFLGNLFDKLIWFIVYEQYVRIHRLRKYFEVHALINTTTAIVRKCKRKLQECYTRFETNENFQR